MNMCYYNYQHTYDISILILSSKHGISTFDQPNKQTFAPHTTTLNIGICWIFCFSKISQRLASIIKKKGIRGLFRMLVKQSWGTKHH